MDFDLIYKQHYTRIHNFCFRLLGNEETARDITQEAFIRLFELQERGHVPRQILAWLYKVSANLSMNHLGRRKRGKEKLVRMGIGKPGDDDPETIYIKLESEDRIRSIIEELKPKHKMLILGYQDGLSYKELSLVTGIALNSVGKTLWRTIGLISKRLNEFENG
jgi:RNA polymerase sigma-70 factor (ECF subfamily)